MEQSASKSSEVREVRMNCRKPGHLGYKAPDGGWGLVVCFGCFMMNLINDGIGFSFGIVFAELLDYYKGTKAETAWIFSISMSVCLLSGPFVAALTSRFGCRSVAAVGSLVTSASYIMSAYTPNLHFLYFSLGLLFGIGYGMMYLPTIVCVSEYFERRRGFATGLSVAGGGVGIFIFSPITAMLIEAYAWRGAILIQAGVVLNGLACSLVYRPLQLTRKLVGEPMQNRKSHDDVAGNEIESEDFINVNLVKKQHEAGTSLYGKELIHTLNSGKEVTDDYKSAVYERPDEGFLNVDSDLTNKPTAIRRYTFCGTNGNLFNYLFVSLKQSCSTYLFKSKAFACFTVSTFFYSLGYYIPYVYLPVKSSDVGVDELGAAWILATLGITNTLGRVVFGYLADRKWVDRLYLYSTSVVICGIGTSLGHVLTSFASILVYAIVFGTFNGAAISLTSVLITDIVGISNLSRAFGISNFVSGLSTLAGPPLAGWLIDVSGSYNSSFLAAGVIITFSGALLYIIPCIDRQWKK